MKILTIENVDHHEQRFVDYMEQFVNDGIEIVDIFSLADNIKEFTTQMKEGDFTHLMFESLLTDDKQFLTLLKMLIDVSTTVEGIRILYSSGELEVFLNQFILKYPDATPYLRQLFDKYEIRAIEYKEFEDASKAKGYFRKIKHIYDTVGIKYYHWSDGSIYFQNERSVIIDPRIDTRPLVPMFFSRIILNGNTLAKFLAETRAMYEHQRDMIESYPDFEDHEEVKNDNKNNMLVLDYLESVVDLTRIT